MRRAGARDGGRVLPALLRRGTARKRGVDEPGVRRFAWLALVALAACGVPAADPAPPTERAALPFAGIAGIPSDADPRCAVIRVVDGDTVEIACRSGAQNVRLVGFDTPETFRPGCPEERALGLRAKEVLTSQLRAARIIAPEVRGEGRYGRPLVALTLDGRPLARSMVAAGVAVPYDGGRRIDWCDRLRRRAT
ncbi:hypothetical protein DXV76_06065 [Rhodobacteraceae bacterium CCMM004]|nr:hypothetical protein DXV76_06065 [Rhodobacteraceae bacterium CCMM004]